MDMFEKRRRVAICRGPHCSARNSAALAELLDAELAAHGLEDDVGTRPGACNKLCDEGPSMVVHPDKIWYSCLTSDAVREIVREHLSRGEPVRRYVARDLSRFDDFGSFEP
jgi:NADP-reducing hydrogenase subunit HndC